jgi:serine/threonine protein kinase
MDIKPENVLIFKSTAQASSDTEKYRATVTDFGCSTWFSNENDDIYMPISQPWNAPEHHSISSCYRPAQCRRMDVFSVGMLCF